MLNTYKCLKSVSSHRSRLGSPHLGRIYQASVNHALSCKKCVFSVALRHVGVRDLLTLLASKLCKKVESVPRLQSLENVQFSHRTALTSLEGRLRIKASGSWQRGVTAFFYVRMTHFISKCNKPTTPIFKEHANIKKRYCQQRVLDVEMGTDVHSIGSWYQRGGMGIEYQMFLKHGADKLLRKDWDAYLNALISWLRTRLFSF